MMKHTMTIMISRPSPMEKQWQRTKNTASFCFTQTYFFKNLRETGKALEMMSFRNCSWCFKWKQLQSFCSFHQTLLMNPKQPQLIFISPPIPRSKVTPKLSRTLTLSPLKTLQDLKVLLTMMRRPLSNNQKWLDQRKRL